MPPMKKYSTMSQRQWGAAVKKVSDMALPLIYRAARGLIRLYHIASRTQTEKPKQPEHHCTQGRPERAERQVTRRQLGVAGKAISFRLVNEQIEGIQPSQKGRISSIEICPRLSARMELL